MKVGFFQFAPRFKDKEANLNIIEAVIKTTEFDLLVFPELSTTGYAFESRDEVLPLAETIPGPTTERIGKTAGERMVVFTLPERKGDKLLNTAVAITQKNLYRYEKIHLFRDEKEIFTPGGQGFPVFTYNGVKIGLMVCFDWIFPEAARTLTLKGTQVICHPSNLVLPYCPDAMVTRSIENRVFTITANRIGTEGPYRFIGLSQITDPDGRILFRASRKEILKVVEIDPGLALDKKVTPENDIIKDRRADQYSL